MILPTSVRSGRLRGSSRRFHVGPRSAPEASLLAVDPSSRRHIPDFAVNLLQNRALCKWSGDGGVKSTDTRHDTWLWSLDGYVVVIVVARDARADDSQLLQCIVSVKGLEYKMTKVT